MNNEGQIKIDCSKYPDVFDEKKFKKNNKDTDVYDVQYYTWDR